MRSYAGRARSSVSLAATSASGGTERASSQYSVSEEFTALFGKNASKQLGFARNPADERITRPIDDLASFQSVALKRRDPKLLPVFDEWHRRFEARAVKPDDVKATATRVRRSTK